MRRQGFTLTEILIVAALMSVISLLGLTALRASGTSLKLTQAQALAQEDVRAVLTEMTRELEMAVKHVREDAPAVTGLEIRLAEPSPLDARDADARVVRELVFCRATLDPLAPWSGPITYQFINEDTNRNGLLDGAENDLDLNRRPTSIILRLEDLNGDGAFDGPGETRIVGAAQSITDLSFAYDGTVLTITVEATRVVPGTAVMTSAGMVSRTVRSTQTGHVYPLN
jgi:prepilin-type N-terminal cleavage/methylation domain-containing protein